ncbi:MAG: YchJ family metal-binding protein [Bdellovibrionota bacterium]
MCPCGSKTDYTECCEPLIKGEADAESPEELMRSRYTAFTVKDMDYVFNTTDPQSRMNFDYNTSKEWAEDSTFTGLEIIRSSDEGNKGMVEFKAHFKDSKGESHVHHEVSKFRKQAGVWFFKEGKLLAEPKTGEDKKS